MSVILSNIVKKLYNIIIIYSNIIIKCLVKRKQLTVIFPMVNLESDLARKLFSKKLGVNYIVHCTLYKQTLLHDGAIYVSVNLQVLLDVSHIAVLPIAHVE